jgi:histidyl-tRNA synthetase
MESQGVAAPLPGPDFFIIDFTADKTRALALSRRFRDLGAAVARDILSRGLDDSLAYARQQRARWAVIIGGPDEADADRVHVVHLADGAAHAVPLAELLEHPAGHFSGFGGQDHA